MADNGASVSYGNVSIVYDFSDPLVKRELGADFAYGNVSTVYEFSDPLIRRELGADFAYGNVSTVYEFSDPLIRRELGADFSYGNVSTVYEFSDPLIKRDISATQITIAPDNGSAINTGAGKTQTIFYKMEGYRPNTQDYEYWISQNTPSNSNPSGQPIQNIRIVSQWIVYS
jgi:hypothetical protein